MPGFPKARPDNGIATALKVTQVPAVFLAQPFTGKITPIGFGVLSESELLERIADLSPERKRRFFLRGTGPNEGMVRVKPHLRQLVEFRQLNLLAPDYGLRQRFLAVFCRNVMIYFDKPTQYEVLRKIAPLLAPGGRFYAGHSESFSHAQDLVQPCGRTIYRAAQEGR